MQLPDYTLDVQQPFAAALQGYQVGMGLEATKQQQLAKYQEAQAALEKKRMTQAAFARLQQPGASAKDYADLAMLLPKGQAESVRESFAMIEGERQKASLNQVGTVFAAFKSGNTEVAIDLLGRQAEAKRNSGDEKGAKFLETWQEIAKERPDAASAFFGFTLSQIPGGDAVIQSAVQIDQNQREKDLHPYALDEQKATSILKQFEAKTAPEVFLAGLGLTKAQIDAAKAAARASNASAAKSAADANRANAEAEQIAVGIIPAEKRPDAEAKMRKEVFDANKVFRDVKSAYGRVLASQENAAGDIALIFNYMKMLDPGSVVREGEFATAQNAGGIDAKVHNMYNRLINGERLKPEQRKMFSKQAEKLYSQAKKEQEVVRAGVERISNNYGLNVQNIFYSETEEDPTAPDAEPSQAQPAATAPPTSATAPIQVTAPNGQIFAFANQEAAQAFKQAAGIN